MRRSARTLGQSARWSLSTTSTVWLQATPARSGRHCRRSCTTRTMPGSRGWTRSGYCCLTTVQASSASGAPRGGRQRRRGGDSPRCDWPDPSSTRASRCGSTFRCRCSPTGAPTSSRRWRARSQTAQKPTLTRRTACTRTAWGTPIERRARARSSSTSTASGRSTGGGSTRSPSRAWRTTPVLAPTESKWRIASAGAHSLSRARRVCSVTTSTPTSPRSRSTPTRHAPASCCSAR